MSCKNNDLTYAIESIHLSLYQIPQIVIIFFLMKESLFQRFCIILSMKLSYLWENCNNNRNAYEGGFRKIKLNQRIIHPNFILFFVLYQHLLLPSLSIVNMLCIPFYQVSVDSSPLFYISLIPELNSGILLVFFIGPANY